MNPPNSLDSAPSAPGLELLSYAPSAQRAYLVADGFAPIENGPIWVRTTDANRTECLLLPETGLVAFEIGDGARRIFFEGMGAHSASLAEDRRSLFVCVNFPDVEGTFAYRLYSGGITIPILGLDGTRGFGSVTTAYAHMLATGLEDTLNSIVLPGEEIPA